ncbi:MAG TPA: ABC transporter permease [Vicinamibacterales bacterium]|nr:ABC transporter permease [Vicinamibacterales bacterium]
MIKPAEWWRRLTFLFRRARLTRELDEELRLHIELRTQANRRLGMTEDEAALAARRGFGNPTVLRETSDETWGWFPMDRLMQDLRYGGRQLLRHPSWTAAAILTLALGIGANTAMFSAINALLFKVPPPIRPDGLVWLSLRSEDMARPRSLSYPAFLASRERHDVFAGVAAFHDVHLSLGDGVPERARGAVVSANFFDVLGVRMALGRAFHADEDVVPGARPVAVLSHALWTKRYGGDPAILNRIIMINGQPFSIVGVAPAGFSGLEIDDPLPSVWMPLAMIGQVLPDFDPAWLTDAGSSWVRTIARLAPGVSIAKADATARGFTWSTDASNPAGRPRPTVRVAAVAGSFFPGEREEVGEVLGLLMIVPVLVLMVAGANAANLLLARGVDRRKELALRRALGASRGRLVRQLLIECLMLTTLAGIVGVGLARVLTAIIGRAGQMPDAILDGFQVDGIVLAATLLVSSVTALVFGLVPAFVASNPALAPTLKEEGITIAIGRRRHRLRDVLVVGQIAVSVVLIVVAGLFLSSLTKALRVDPGFEARDGATLSFDLALQGYRPAARDAFIREVLDRTRAVAAIESAALTTALPLGGRMFGTEVVRPGAEADDDAVSTFNAAVSPEYFATMKIALTRGRDFTALDTRSSPPVVIVNDALARRLWPSADPIGQRLRLLGLDDGWREVVGVARTTRYDDLTESPASYVYVPLAQFPPASLSLVARAWPEAGPVLPALEAVMRSLDPQLPVVDARTFEQVILRSVGKQRAASALLAVLGGLALLLAALGIYGVMSHATMLRVKEIGIRMALGARAPDVRRMFVRESLKLCFIGVAIGAAAATVISKLIAGFLFGLAAGDAVTFLIAAVVMCASAILATYLPARRAARVSPLIALRN